MIKTLLSESASFDEVIRPAFEQAGCNGMDQVFREYALPAGRVVVTCVASLRRLCADLRRRLAARQSVQAQLAKAFIEERA